ncbi:alpha/beta hydrolase [Salinifilum ghardaiensis]
MSMLARPAVAALAARTMQWAVRLTRTPGRERYPACPRRVVELPREAAPARAVVYLPEQPTGAPVYVNFHGSGFVLPLTEWEDPLCRYLAAEAGVVVVNVDYALAPQHRFPEPAHQAFDVLRWIAERGGARGWDAGRLCVGGQSAGGNLATAAARQALEHGGPPIALQVLHYPVLDLVGDRPYEPSGPNTPVLRPWMRDVFDHSYVPDPAQRTHRLASPAHPGDSADLSGMAPAVVITAEHDVLRPEAERYAERLRTAGALLEHHVVTGTDHGYDMHDTRPVRETYARIAGHVRRATEPAHHAERSR